MMVKVADFTKEKPKPALVIFPKRTPIEKIYAFDAPESRGGIIIREDLLCPNCRTIEAVLERHWVGGQGYIVMLICDRCHYWERSVK